MAPSRRHGRIRGQGAAAARPLSPEARLRAHARARPGASAQRKPAKKAPAAPIFVVQKHWASRLHYDFRLEHDGVLLSWAVPKGPSFDPSKMQMAIHVEDHPLAYGGFEGTIPPKPYGAGKVIVWDRGTWEPVGDPREGMAKGKLLFRLHGAEARGPVGAGAHRQARRPPGSVDAVQEEGRVGAAAGRVRRDRGPARQRRRDAARPASRRASRGRARGASREAAPAAARPPDLATAAEARRCRRGSSRSSRPWQRRRPPATG